MSRLHRGELPSTVEVAGPRMEGELRGESGLHARSARWVISERSGGRSSSSRCRRSQGHRPVETRRLARPRPRLSPAAPEPVTGRVGDNGLQRRQLQERRGGNVDRLAQ